MLQGMPVNWVGTFYAKCRFNTLPTWGLCLLALVAMACSMPDGKDEFVVAAPRVFDIAPKNATAGYGSQIQFKIKNDIAAYWELLTAENGGAFETAAQTSIDSSGLLSIAKEETAKSFAVRATSVLGGKQTTAQVRLINYIALTDENIDEGDAIGRAGVVTVRVSDATFSIEGLTPPEMNVSNLLLSENGLALNALSGDRRVAVFGGNENIPLVIHVANSNLDVASVNPVIGLADNANVEMIIEGANTMKTSGTSDGSHAGIHVPYGSSINIRGLDADVTANMLSVEAPHNSAPGVPHGAAIGGQGNSSETAGAGKISISGGLSLSAQAYYYGAGIGGGDCGGWDTISISGNSVVNSVSTGASNAGGAAGIGSGFQGSGGIIIIQDDALVRATGNAEGAGIGGGLSTDYAASKTDITILGNAKVFAQGGSLCAAGIGGGYVESGAKTHDLSITIGDGTDHPLVIAHGGSNTYYDRYPPAIGMNGYSGAQGSVIITINSGFVAVQGGDQDNAPDIGLPADILGISEALVMIRGGSVYAVRAKIFPPPINAKGSLVYPAYMPAVFGPFAFKTNLEPVEIDVAVPDAPYRGLAIDARSDEFMENDFPCDILAAVLWLPAPNYAHIKVGNLSDISIRVNPIYPVFSNELATNRFIE
jgi:hypothetical protein